MKNAVATHAIGTARLPDHRTSIAAAEKIKGKALSIREQVEIFAKHRPYGFTDDDLKIAWPSTEEHPCAESSYRRRRTELSEENIICARGDTQKNRAGNDELIWVHRDHLHYPPPLKAQERKPSKFEALQNEIARLKGGVLRERTVIVQFLRTRKVNPTASPKEAIDWYASLIEAEAHIFKAGRP